MLCVASGSKPRGNAAAVSTHGGKSCLCWGWWVVVLEERLYGHPGCGERGRFGEEMTWGMQVFLLWLLVDSQGKRGLVMVTCFSQPPCILKYCGVRQNSPKVFLHHNLLGTHQPGATNSSQKSSDSLLLWKVYPWLRTTQIAKWRELMYFYLCWAHFPYWFGNVLSDFSWKQHIR